MSQGTKRTCRGQKPNVPQMWQPSLYIGKRRNVPLGHAFSMLSRRKCPRLSPNVPCQCPRIVAASRACAEGFYITSPRGSPLKGAYPVNSEQEGSSLWV